MCSKQGKDLINLNGSVDFVLELLEFGINNILYLRGLYPPESFQKVLKYGLPVLMTTSEDLKKFIGVILKQLREYLLCKNIHKVDLVIVNVATNETVERWEFSFQTENVSGVDCIEGNIKEIQTNIRDVIRQITASVTFLPCLEGSFSFDILLYTDKTTCLPSAEWSDADPHNIDSEQKVELRSFNTNIHKVNPAVAYKAPY